MSVLKKICTEKKEVYFLFEIEKCDKNKLSKNFFLNKQTLERGLFHTAFSERLKISERNLIIMLYEN